MTQKLSHVTQRILDDGLRAILMVIIFVALSMSLSAQQTGSIVGTVADPTGAVIPHAKVILTDMATKDIRATTTNAEGFFAFSGVVVGDFSVQVEANGFQSVEQSGIHVGPGDRRNLNVSLVVARGNASVVVKANTSAIIVDSGDLSSTLYSGDISKLALQGRDVTELIKVLPGFNTFTNFGGMQNKPGYDTTVTSIQSAVGNAISAPGVVSRAGGADLVSDGAHILDPGCNCNALQTVNPDMVAEVKVTSSAYDGSQVTGPVVVSAVSKSGTTSYHGAAYLHFRDAAMNSNDWIFKYNKQARPTERYWYPGGQIGGPVPFTHKKLLGFGGYEYYNQLFPEQTSGGLLKANVPTLSERAGHFDPTLQDNAAACSAMASWVSGGYRCQQFTTIDTPNGVVTGIANDDISSYLAPGGLALLNEIPKPNHTPTSVQDYNYLEPLMNTNNGYMFHARVDYNINNNTKLYVSYNQQHELYGQPVMRWWLAPDSVSYPGGISSDAHSRTISSSLVTVFNATTTNEVMADMGYLYTPEILGNEKVVDKTATNYPYTYPTTAKILPSVNNTWWNSDFGVPFQYDTGRYYYFIHKVQPSLTDDFTKVFRTHTLKTGISWLGVWDKEDNVGQGDGPQGTIGYGPIWGLPSAPDGSAAYGLDPVLNFMTDLAGSFATAPVTTSDMTGYSLGFYAEDKWQVTKRLTVNYSMRFTHDTPYSDATGRWGASAWTPQWYNTDVANGVTDLPGMRWHGKDAMGVHSDPSLSLAGHTLNSLFYEPRFGIAYDVYGTGKTVFRGGFGVYYYRDGLGGTSGTTMAQGGTACSTTSWMLLSQINANTISCANTLSGLTSGTAVDPHDHTEPRTLTYNFTLSQQTFGKTVVQISYMGSQSANLINGLYANLNNQIPIGAYMNPDPNPASPDYGKVMPIYQISSSLTQDYRPYTHYTSLNLITHSGGDVANYNALQVEWWKRQGALTYNLNYTWSKTLGTNSTVDPFNINNDYGLLSADRTQVLNATYAYSVGNRFKGNKLESATLNGWMISGITGVQSGPPVQESFSMTMGFGGTDAVPDNKVDINGTSTDLGLNTISNSYFLGTPGYSLIPRVTCNPGAGLKKGQFINPSCFSIPALPQIDPNTGVMTAVGGNGQTQMPYFRGPKYFSSDLAMSRTFDITEHKSAEIKFSATNFLNHPLISFDQNNANNLNLNFTSGVLQTTGAGNGGSWYYGIPNEKFGRRVLEMSLRYNF